MKLPSLLISIFNPITFYNMYVFVFHGTGVFLGLGSGEAMTLIGFLKVVIIPIFIFFIPNYLFLSRYKGRHVWKFTLCYLFSFSLFVLFGFFDAIYRNYFLAS